VVEQLADRLRKIIPTQSNFAFAFLLLPKARREALKAAYGFCRAVDDAVDEVSDREEGMRILETWRTQLRLAYRGEATTTEGRDLQQAVRQFQIHERDLQDILTGVEMDLTKTRYQSFEELYRYCYHVASAVGLVAIEIFGHSDDDTKLYAEKLGVALQLTNILRDVREDAGRGRVYLPADDLARFGVKEEDLFAGRYTEAFFDLMTFEAGRAHRYYEEARAALPKSARRKLASAETMGEIYFALLRAIEARGFRVFDERVTVPNGEKMKIAISHFFSSHFLWS
jgi:phytoene synthase